jgi:hypothetical protein
MSGLDYEAQRRANIAKNREAIMALLGAQGVAEAEAAAVAFKPVPVKRVAKPTTPRKRRSIVQPVPVYDSTVGGRRRSARLQGDRPPEPAELCDSDASAYDSDGHHHPCDDRPVKRPAIKRDNTFGAIEGEDFQ